jgi:LysR family transcriptional regulator, hydrogen peroxide-inducible genes activator
MTTPGAPFDPRATAVPVLRYLVAVADHRHFGRAAAAASVSQPTLSAMVTQWERRMRCVVFERGARGVSLTPVGERVVAAARRALIALEEVERVASLARPPFFGPLRLGVIPTVGPYALPSVTAALTRAYPDLEAPIREGTTAELSAALDAGRIDIALLAVLPGMAERYVVEDLYDEPFHVALPRGHRLAKRSVITVADLADEHLLLLDEGHCLREQALQVCQRRLDPGSGPDYRATSLETLRQIVASGAGVTLLPALAVQEDDRRLVMRPLEDDAGRRIALIWRRNDPRSDAYRLLSAPIRRALPRDRIRVR